LLGVWDWKDWNDLGEILKSKEKKVKLLVLLYRGFGAQGYFYDAEETKDIININFRWGLVKNTLEPVDVEDMSTKIHI